MELDLGRGPWFQRRPSVARDIVRARSLIPSSPADISSVPPATRHNSTKRHSIWSTRSLGILLFPWPMPRFPLYVRLVTSKSTPAMCGSREPNFIAPVHWHWIRTCPKDTSLALFCSGDRRRISSTWKPSPNSSELSPFRAICLMLTTVSARFSPISGCSSMRVKCMRGRGAFTLKRRLATASFRFMSGIANTN